MRRATAASIRALRAPVLEPLEHRHLMAGWSPVGPETLVNDTTAGIEQTTFASHKAIATDDNGHYVVVWSGNGTGDADGVYARRFDASGAVGASFRVNTTVAGTQAEAAVTMDNAGNFIVVWSSNGQDGSGWGVYGQRYNAAGVAQGGEFRVNVTTAGNQNQPSVAADFNGDFVVSWTTENIDGAGQGLGIAAHRYTAAGAAIGGEIHVNGYTPGDQDYSRVAIDDAGNFTIIWQSDFLPTSSIGIFGQRYNAAGAAQGTWFVINTTTTGLQRVPAIGMNASGAFVVAWTSDGQDGSGRGIYAQRYSAAGAKVGAELLVNTTTAGDQQYPSVAIDDAGAFVITWESNGQDGSGWGAYAQQYSSAGAPVSGEERLNTTTANNQQNVSIATVGGGDYITVWSGGGAGDANGVFLQRYEDLLPDVVVTPTSGLTTTSAGGAASFTIVLASRPQANVTVSLSSSDTTEGTISVPSVTFTVANWNTPQTVVVTGVNDGVAEGSVAYSIVTAAAVSTDPSYSGRAVADVSVVNVDGSGTGGGGLRGTYFDNVDFTGTRVARLDPSVNFSWAYGSPDPLIGPDTFSVRWTGEIQPRYGQTYTFYATSDDGVRVWINGVLVIQNWTDHISTVDTGTVPLAANQWYSIVVEMYENAGVGVARLEWSSASQAREIVPPTRLRPQNTAPVAQDDAYSVVAGSTLSVPAAGVLANDSDADDDTLVLSLLGAPANGSLVLNADGSFTYTPAGGFVGTDTFSYSVADGWGGSDTAIVTITVANAPPSVVTSATALQYTENAGAVPVDAGLTVTDANDNVLTGATVMILGYVAGQDVLSFAGGGGITGSWNAASGTLTLSGSATVAAYQAALRSVAYSNTSDNPSVAGRSVRFVVNDGRTNSAPASRSLVVTPVNDSPIAAPDSYTGDADAPLAVTAAAGVLANDSDVDGGPLTAVLTQQASNGTVQLFANGSFNYTPNAGFFGTDHFVYRADDGAGGSSTATVTIQVTLVPAPGIKVNPTGGLTTTESGGAASFTVVLTRQPTAAVRIDLAPSLAGEGALSATALVFDSSNWNVPQTVTVTGLDDGIDDGDRTYLIQSAPAVSADSLYNGLDAADVSITNVARSPLPPPAPPVATADRYTVAFGKVLSVAPAGVLANDATASGQPMTAVLARQTSHGVVALTPDGAFTYTPASGFAGVDRFAYAASNSGGRSAPADVTVVVEAPADQGPAGPPAVPPPLAPPHPEVPPAPELPPVHEGSTQQPEVIHSTGDSARTTEPASKQPSGNPSGPAVAAPLIMPKRADPALVLRKQESSDAAARRRDNNTNDEEPSAPVRVIEASHEISPPAGLVAAPLLSAVGPLATKIDAMSRQIANGNPAHNATIRSVSQVALAMTAGYVMWSLRGASLLASLVTSLPLWRSLDPLPILEARADKAAVAAKKRRRKKARRGRGSQDEDEKLSTMVN